MSHPDRGGRDSPGTSRGRGNRGHGSQGRPERGGNSQGNRRYEIHSLVPKPCVLLV